MVLSRSGALLLCVFLGAGCGGEDETNLGSVSTGPMGGGNANAGGLVSEHRRDERCRRRWRHRRRSHGRRRHRRRRWQRGRERRRRQGREQRQRGQGREQRQRGQGREQRERRHRARRQRRQRRQRRHTRQLPRGTTIDDGDLRDRGVDVRLRRLRSHLRVCRRRVGLRADRPLHPPLPCRGAGVPLDLSPEGHGLRL
jgi:hypothetical protein